MGRGSDGGESFVSDRRGSVLKDLGVPQTLVEIGVGGGGGGRRRVQFLWSDG